MDERTRPTLIDVLDRVLDKGIVIDASVRISLVGVDLLGMRAKIVVSSFEAYLRLAEDPRAAALGLVPDLGAREPVAREPGVRDPVALGAVALQPEEETVPRRVAKRRSAGRWQGPVRGRPEIPPRLAEPRPNPGGAVGAMAALERGEGGAVAG